MQKKFSVIFVLVGVPMLICALDRPNIQFSTKICPELLAKLEKGELVNILVSFAEGTDKVLNEVSSLRISDRGQKGEAIYNALLANADKSQTGVESLLKSTSRNAGTEFRKFWISNQLWVKDADLKTVRNIAEDSQVTQIKEEPIEQLIRGNEIDLKSPRAFEPPPPPGTIQWNIQYMQVPEAWQEIGNKGEGVVVGFIDTGVMPTHETLRHNFRGDYGWLDPIERKLEPFDDGQHGTHVAGIAVGTNGIGVAPGAQWAMCHACIAVGCVSRALLECGEFFACPTLANGTGRDCSKAPRIVSNSWGGGKGKYDNMIAVWRSMDIIPVFGIGNGPPNGCASANYPGSHADVIGVGNLSQENTTDHTNTQKGPTEDGRIKPDLAAHGMDILSGQGFTGGVVKDNDYQRIRGTSQSCPHVAGAVALLLSRDITMTFEQVKEYLFNNADRDNLKEPWKDEVPPMPTCGTVINGTIVWPNNHYGYGLVNAYKAVKAQSLAMTNITR